ncbi:hypothetical protein GWK47_012871 [Chionoecetes opilio]|uniref:Uncharacterized protein n=1 Tax=Chionoecetes opilio TaxID=41210 RepID=A0A8J4XYC4_CHIOP|nr:hypothetical protein GWK47_012871 [Chionoecetes opilio]
MSLLREVSKYMKAAKTREPLIQCVELRADEKIRRAAKGKLNQRILGLLSRDLVAAEGPLPQVGYKLFTKDDSPAAPSSRLQVCAREGPAEITKSKIRSITLTASILPIYNVGRRAGPPRIETAYVDTTKEVQDSKTKNFIWLLTRIQTMKNQSISSWTGSTSKPAEHCSGPGHRSMNTSCKVAFGPRSVARIPFGRIPVDQTIEETDQQRHPDTRGNPKGFPPERWSCRQHREKLGGKELYVTCEQLCFKITKEQMGRGVLSLSQVKKKQTHASFSMHFMQQNLGTSLSSSLQRIQTSWSCVWAGCDKPSVHSLAGEDDDTPKQVKMDKTYQDAFHELGRSWEVSPELFEKLQEITCPHVPAIYPHKLR